MKTSIGKQKRFMLSLQLMGTPRLYHVGLRHSHFGVYQIGDV